MNYIACSVKTWTSEPSAQYYLRHSSSPEWHIRHAAWYKINGTSKSSSSYVCCDTATSLLFRDVQKEKGGTTTKETK
jgi:hypothetical protein